MRDDPLAQGLDLLPVPLSLYDVNGTVLFSNWASTKYTPCNPPLELWSSKGVDLAREEGCLPLPLHSWTERLQTKGQSDGEARIFSCNAYQAFESSVDDPMFIVMRHDVTMLCKQQQLADMEVQSLHVSLSESKDYVRRLQQAAQDMANSMDELRSLLDGSSRQLGAAASHEPLRSPTTGSHMSALVASFDACMRRFRSISAVPPLLSAHGTSALPTSPLLQSYSLDAPPSRRSAPQVSFVPPSALGASPLQQQGSSANSRHPPTNQRKPKSHHQQGGSSGSSGLEQAASPALLNTFSGGSNQLRRLNSSSELSGADVADSYGSGGKPAANSKGSTNQLSMRVGQLQEQLVQLQSKHNAVCVHVAELVQENRALQQQVAQGHPHAAAAVGEASQGPCNALQEECSHAAKQAFDTQLNKAQQEAIQLKAEYDKYVLGAHEEQQGYSAQLHKVKADAHLFKSMYDREAVDARARKQHFDTELLQAHARAAEYKAQLDKGEMDAVEQKELFDVQLLKANTDAAEFKAMYDKGGFDAVEAKQFHDAQLLKANVDAAEYKAQFDKSELDAVEQKQLFDAQLLKANTDAAEFKAMFDKGELDAVEAKQFHDAQLLKANVDASEYKAQFDKSELDAVEQKQLFDAQLLKANTDAAEFKAMYDKGEEDALEQKRLLDAQVAEAKARAAELKAMFDKGELDAATAKEMHEQQMKELCARNNSLEMQAMRDKLLAEFTKETLTHEQEQLHHLRSEHEQLLRKQAVLQEELQLALNNYRPSAVIDAGTPADKMLSMMAELLDGMVPSIQDILFVQSAVLESLDIYQPVNVGKQLLHSTNLDEDVGLSLLQQLGPEERVSSSLATLAGPDANASSLTLKDFSESGRQNPPRRWNSEITKNAQDGSQPQRDSNGDTRFSLLESALESIMSPMFDKDVYPYGTIGRSSCAGSEASFPASVTSVFSCTPAVFNTSHTGSVFGGAGAAGCSSSSAAQTHPPSAATVTNSVLAAAAAGPTASSSTHTPSSMLSALHKRCLRVPKASSTFTSLSPSSAAPVLDAAAAAAAAAAGGPPQAPCDGSRYLNGQSRMRLSLQLEPEGLRVCQPQQSDRWEEQQAMGPQDQQQQQQQQQQGSSRRQSSGDLTTYTAEEMDHFPNPSAGPIMDEVNAVLASACHWQFDSFKLNEVTQGHPLSTLAFYTLHTEGLIDHFDLKPASLARFLRHVEQGYHNNPYHSKVHAADVMQTMHVILKRGGLVPGYADPLTHLACLLAAVIHDYEHVGCTNDFLINKCDDLAVRYNDRAPLENHHLAAAFMLLKQREFDFLAGMPKASFDRLRKLVIELVLATDMKQHFAIVSHFTTIHRLSGSDSLTPSAPSLKDARGHLTCGRSESGYSSAGHHSTNSGEHGCSGAYPVIVPLDEAERLLSLQVALKCSDLGHTASSLPVHLRWVAALEEEFFRQGDAERAAGMTISPLFDRNKQGISKSQVGFYDIVVIPLFHAFARVFPGSRPLLTYVMRNYKVWTEQGAGHSNSNSARSNSGGQLPLADHSSRDAKE